MVPDGVVWQYDLRKSYAPDKQPLYMFFCFIGAQAQRSNHGPFSSGRPWGGQKRCALRQKRGFAREVHEEKCVGGRLSMAGCGWISISVVRSVPCASRAADVGRRLDSAFGPGGQASLLLASLRAFTALAATLYRMRGAISWCKPCARYALAFLPLMRAPAMLPFSPQPEFIRRNV